MRILGRQTAKVRKQRQLQKSEALRANINHNPQVEKHVRAAVSHGPSQPLVFLQTEEGRITAHPHEVDGILRKAWGQVYQGNSPCHVRTTAEFLARYRGHLYVQSRPEQLRPLTADDILKGGTTSAATAAGWDPWEAADWRHLSRKAAQALADLLNCIENGAPWPEPARWGNAKLLSKTDLPTLDPRGCRILLVLQSLYRCVASITLNQLEAWP